MELKKATVYYWCDLMVVSDWFKKDRMELESDVREHVVWLKIFGGYSKCRIGSHIRKGDH